VVGIVLVIHFEHGKSLGLGGSGVVTAFCGLDGLGGFGGATGGRFWVGVFGV
jgi:hypothetical protein